MDSVGLERWTAFLAQAAATVLVLIGLVVLLSFTHMRSYRAGLCADGSCDTAQADPSEAGQTSPVNAYPQSGYLNATAAAAQSGVPQSARPPGGPIPRPQPDPPPSINTGQPSSGSALPVGDARPVNPPPNVLPYLTPGEEICSNPPEGTTLAARARCWLRVGDAYQSIGLTDYAQDAWNQALMAGAERGAQASLTAQQRLQGAVLAQSCPTSADSLARIANGYNREDVNGEIIDLRHRQAALAALGYYTGDLDGTYGPNTRRAVRDFQADMGFDQTGALNPQETVDLVCHAAITARDPGAQNMLGIMFATGLGVDLNVDMATEWLEMAATRDHPEANYNLALIYGTGTLEGSYRLCNIVESPQRADSYLRRAADLGHPRATYWRRQEGTGGNPATRWSRIAERMRSSAVLSGDRFYLAWQRRLDEAERQAVYGALQPGCYLESIETRQEAGQQAR